MKEKTKRLSRQEELFFALGFSQQELELNRKGILSKQQSARVWETVNFRRQLGFAIFCGLVAFVIFAFVIWSTLMAVSDNVVFRPEVLCLISFFSISGIMCLIPTKPVISLYKAIRSDLKVKKLKHVEGLAIVDLGGQQRAGSFSINGHYLRVNHATLLRIKHLEPHRVYYLPHSKVAVAVEVMER